MMCLQNIEHACALHIPASRSEKHGRSAVRIPTFLWSALTSARGQPKTRAGIACLDSAELVAFLEVPSSFSETTKGVRYAGVPYYCYIVVLMRECQGLSSTKGIFRRIKKGAV